MIGSIDRSVREVTVVGAGISGLLAAYYLDRAGYEVTLQESSGRAGGLIHTEATPWGIAERAAHSILATPELKALCADLGVDLAPVNDGSKSRYILRGGRLRRFPLGPGEVLSLAGNALFAKAGPQDLSVYGWARNHLGDAAADYLLQPFVMGIYGASAKELDLKAAFPRLQVPQGKTLRAHLFALRKARKQEGAGRAEMMAPLLGMGTLVSRLELRLKERLGGRFRLGAAAESIPSGGNRVICVPAPEAARLLGSEAPEAAQALEQVRYAPLVTSTVFFRADSLRTRPKGVGVLIPPGEKRRALGVLFNSSSFPGRVNSRVMAEGELVSFTMILGGTLRPEILKADDDSLRRTVHEEFNALFGVNENPVHLEFWRHEHAIPVYSSTLRRTWKSVSESWASKPGSVLFGNYTGQVSIRGMLASAAALADQPPTGS